MRLLLAVSRYPWPPRRGDQLRAAQMVELLAAEHEIVLLAPEPPPGAPDPPDACRLEPYRRSGPARRALGVAKALAAGEPLQNGLFAHPGLARRLAELAPGTDLVVLQLARLAAYRELAGPTPTAIDLIDSLALNIDRRARFDRAWLRPPLRAEARRLARAERRMLAATRGALVVCPRDRQAILAGLPRERRDDLGSRLGVLPLAFPLLAERAAPQAEPAVSGGEVAARAPTLCMTGNLGYFPAVDGFGWWLREVLPVLREGVPGVRVVLAGARPAATLRRLAARTGAHLVDSPADLGAVIAAADLALAPLRCGSGQPLKILEAWQAGTAVVSSPWAAAGVAAPGGLEIADTPGQWVETISRLLADTAARRQRVREGRSLLDRHYSRARVRSELERWVRSCAES